MEDNNMKYFKIIRNCKVVDLLSYETSPTYVKYQFANKILVRSSLKNAQGIVSDNEKVYHTSSLLPFPVESYPTVTLEEITENEYEQIKNLEFKTADEIRQELMMDILERGML
jgi:hypothetical protein